MTIVLGTRFIRYGLIAGGLLVADGTRAADATLPPVTADVLGHLHEANQKEIQAGEIAQKDGRSKAVKEYGKMLVKDNTAADKEVTDLAQSENVNLQSSTPAPGPNDMGDDGLRARLRQDVRPGDAGRSPQGDRGGDRGAQQHGRSAAPKAAGRAAPGAAKARSGAEKIIDAEANK